MIESLFLAAAALFLCRSSFTGAFAFEFNLALAGAAFAVFFAGGLYRLRRGQSTGAIVRALCALGVPLAIVLAFGMKYATCRYGVGFAWFALLPAASAVFGLASAVFGHRRGKAVGGAIFLGLAPSLAYLALIGFDFYFRPSLFVFHPAFGYYPGPLYDEFIPILPKVLTFRAWTLLLAAWLAFEARLPRGMRYAALALLLLPLAFRPALGWNHTHASVRRVLDESRTRGPVTLRYRADSFANPADAAAYLANLAYYVEEIAAKLGMTPPDIEPFHVYLYPDAATKYDLTGTRDTDIGHPLQRVVHILNEPAWSPTLPHELSHVISGAFAPPLLRAPLNQSMLEGFATSLEEYRGGLSVHEWAKAMATLGLLPNLEKLFGPLGFLAEAPFRAYLASGSFLQWLRETQGPVKLRRYYGGEDFAAVYGEPFAAAVERWKFFLSTLPLFENTVAQARLALEAKPIFQRRCPHDVAAALEASAACDPKMPPACRSDALADALAYSGGDPSIALLLAQDLLRRDDPAAARATLDAAANALGKAAVPLRARAAMLDGDLRALRGETQGADAAYAGIDGRGSSDTFRAILALKRSLIAHGHADLLRRWVKDGVDALGPELYERLRNPSLGLFYLVLQRKVDARDAKELDAMLDHAQAFDRGWRRSFEDSLRLAQGYEITRDYATAMRTLENAKPAADTLGRAARIEREVRRMAFLGHSGTGNFRQ